MLRRSYFSIGVLLALLTAFRAAAAVEAGAAREIDGCSSVRSEPTGMDYVQQEPIESQSVRTAQRASPIGGGRNHGRASGVFRLNLARHQRETLQKVEIPAPQGELRMLRIAQANEFGIVVAG